MKDIIVKNWFYLSQRDNVDTLDINRKPEPSNQCMIASFSMWILQFSRWANIQKWCNEWKQESIEEILHTIIESRVIDLNKILPKDKQTSRFVSSNFIDALNLMLKEYKFIMIKEKADISKICEIIDSGQSVVCGTNISKLRGASGHIQNFIGYKKDDAGNILGLYSCDPYGNYETLYTNHSGKSVFYNRDTVNGLLSPCYKGDVRLMIYAEKTK